MPTRARCDLGLLERAFRPFEPPSAQLAPVVHPLRPGLQLYHQPELIVTGDLLEETLVASSTQMAAPIRTQSVVTSTPAAFAPDGTLHLNAGSDSLEACFFPLPTSVLPVNVLLLMLVTCFRTLSFSSS